MDVLKHLFFCRKKTIIRLRSRVKGCLINAGPATILIDYGVHPLSQTCFSQNFFMKQFREEKCQTKHDWSNMFDSHLAIAVLVIKYCDKLCAIFSFKGRCCMNNILRYKSCLQGR